MKNKFFKILMILLVILFFIISMEPNIKYYLKDNITFESYFFIIISLAVIIFEIIFYLKNNNDTKNAFNLMKSDAGFRILKKEKKYKQNKGFYYRDIPFKNDLFKTFFIAYQYEMINNRTNLLNALILKWYYEKRIDFVSKNKYIINDIQDDFDNSHERDLFQLLNNTSKTKLKKLTMFNSKPIFNKIDNILLDELQIYKNFGYIDKQKDIILEKINTDVDMVFGLRNFLLDFSNIDDKSIKEVKLFEEYLIYAELFGISKKVRKELDRANIEFSASEVRFKNINSGIINIFKVLLFVSYIFYGIMFIIFTYFIWYFYALITWS